MKTLSLDFNMKKVAIFTTKGYSNRLSFSKHLHDEIGLKNIKTIVVAKEPKELNNLVNEFTFENNIDKEVFEKNEETFGKNASFIRDRSIINNCDCVFAIWDEEDLEIRNALRIAKEKKKEIIVYNPKFCEVYKIGRVRDK